MQINHSYNEKELLLKTAAGDQQAFTQLVERYRSNIYTTAFRLTGSEQIAEEIMQDVFLKIWIRREKLLEIENFASYLYIIAKRDTFRVMKQLAKEKEYISFGISDVGEPGTEYEGSITRHEYLNLIEAAVEKLPAKQQETFKLIRQDGLKREEAALLLGVSPETVKYNLEQAIKKVRAYCIARAEILFLLGGFIKVVCFR